MKSYHQYGRVLALLFAAIFSICTGFSQAAPSASTVKENTKKLLTEFLINEDMAALEAMLDDGLKFHWPDKSVIDKNALMQVCEALARRNVSQADVIDVMAEDNRAFILFVWSGRIEVDENEQLLGKEFSIHNGWKLTWKNDKVIEWYTIWGSRDYMNQLGYKFIPPGD